MHSLDKKAEQHDSFQVLHMQLIVDCLTVHARWYLFFKWIPAFISSF